VDLRVAGEGAGGPVRSPADGRLRFVADVAGKPVVVVEHAEGLRSTFEPVTSDLAIGALVTRGQVVGEVTDAPGHCAPLTCLHWGVLRGDTYLDPLALLGPRGVRLLPLR
jgi:murein DD-endopeptidase MepM/ murein hydrolase activator NlpD